MSKVSYGAKAGLVAGLFYGIVEGVLGYFSVVSQKTAVMALINKSIPAGSSITPQQLYQAALYGTVLIFILAGLLIGTFLGVIFAMINESTPGKSNVRKGLVFGLLIWIILDTIVLAVNYSLGISYIGVTLITNLITSMIYGYVLGLIFGRYRKKDRTMEDEIMEMLG